MAMLGRLSRIVHHLPKSAIKPTMSEKLIFITGATGFIGSQVVDVALKAGYRVRLSVRKAEQIDELKQLFASQVDKLEFVVIPNLTAADAFENKLDGVDYICHIASPMPGKGVDVRADYVAPAVQGTEAILSAAKATPSVRRVVITASVLSLVPLNAFQSKEPVVVKEDSFFDLSVDLDMEFPSDFSGHGIKYQASKILAHKASLAFMEKYKPHFDLKTIHPTFVIGPSLIQKSAKDIGGINAAFWGSLFSEKPRIPTVCVHVTDVADAHLKALEAPNDSPIEYLVSGPRFSWDDVLEYLKSKYPQLEVKLQGPFDPPAVIDTSRAEAVLGMKWRGMEQMISDVVDQQLGFEK